MRFQILLLTLMTSKNEQSFKQHCHPYQKFHLKFFIELLTGKNIPGNK